MLITTLTTWLKFPGGFGQAAEAFPGNYLVQALVRWDAGWYFGIARDGYFYTPGQQSSVAFFPVYPMLMRAVSALSGLHQYPAGILITMVAGLLGITQFARWARTLADEGTALLASLLLVVYPFAFYLYGVVYSDAVFLLVSVSAFWAMEKRQVALATVLGMIATASRPVAPAVVLGLLVRNLELRHREGGRYRPQDFLPLLAGLGMAGYMLFLGHQFGEPTAFALVQGAPGWDQAPGWRTWLKLTWFKTMFPRVDPLVAIRLSGHALVTFAMLGLVLPMRRLLGWGYAVYVACVVGIPAVGTKDFQGLGRYAIAAFPCFLTLAMLIGPRPVLRRAWLAVSGVILGLLAVAWGSGGYVS